MEDLTTLKDLYQQDRDMDRRKRDAEEDRPERGYVTALRRVRRRTVIKWYRPLTGKLSRDLGGQEERTENRGSVSGVRWGTSYFAHRVAPRGQEPTPREVTVVVRVEVGGPDVRRPGAQRPVRRLKVTVLLTSVLGHAWPGRDSSEERHLR